MTSSARSISLSRSASVSLLQRARFASAQIAPLVLGSGPAGEKGAAEAAYFGKKVALVEQAPSLDGASIRWVFCPRRRYCWRIDLLEGQSLAVARRQDRCKTCPLRLRQQYQRIETRGDGIQVVLLTPWFRCTQYVGRAMAAA